MFVCGDGSQKHDVGRASVRSSENIEPKILTQRLVTPHPERLSYIRYALREGMSVRELHQMTGIDPWFVDEVGPVGRLALSLQGRGVGEIAGRTIKEAKRAGLSEDVSPHWLRHAAITFWAKDDLTSAQRLAGHRQIATTQRYLGSSDAELKAFFKRQAHRRSAAPTGASGSTQRVPGFWQASCPMPSL